MKPTLSRQEHRDAIRETVMDRAARDIALIGHSMVCAAGNHDRCKGGPADFDTCLCECHDTPPVTERAS